MSPTPSWPALFAIALLCASGSARANPPIERQIGEIDAKLEAGPDVRLLLQRGQLRRARGDYAGALADYELAATLSPGDTRVPLLRGQALLLLGRPSEAVDALNPHLVASPESLQGLQLRAQAWSALGEWAAAEADLEEALRLGRGSPELYLARAQAQAEQGAAGLKRAVQGLDDAQLTLGQLVVLQERAVEMELKAGDLPAALDRLQRLTETLNHKERHLAWQGDLRAQQGQVLQAAEAWRLALQAVEALPPGRRQVPSAVALEAALRACLSGPCPGASGRGAR